MPAGMGSGTNQPTVVLRDGPPPLVVCRTVEEEAACLELLRALRRGLEPVALILRTRAGGVEVIARGHAFHSMGHVEATFTEAKAKVFATLFRRATP